MHPGTANAIARSKRNYIVRYVRIFETFPHLLVAHGGGWRGRSPEFYCEPLVRNPSERSASRVPLFCVSVSRSCTQREGSRRLTFCRSGVPGRIKKMASPGESGVPASPFPPAVSSATYRRPLKHKVSTNPASGEKGAFRKKFLSHTSSTETHAL